MGTYLYYQNFIEHWNAVMLSEGPANNVLSLYVIYTAFWLRVTTITMYMNNIYSIY